MLATIEQEENVRILYACEPGSSIILVNDECSRNFTRVLTLAEIHPVCLYSRKSRYYQQM